MPYQEIEQLQPESPKHFETVFQPDDMLLIVVSAEDQEIAEPYNVYGTVVSTTGSGVGQRQQHTYLVDEEGYIEFPVIGRIHVAGKTKAELTDYLKKEISKDIKNPIINIRITNYKVTVHGEVNRAGVHTIGSERITLPEALALSGDMTIYGNRKKILVMREENGIRKSEYVDITNADFMNSDFYYLKQNDIVFVEQNNVRKNSAAVGPNISTMFSAISLLVSIITLGIRINN
ncbi:MAG TPA: polysaccharide biosynthesis/export family protein [Flavobacterium sp.]|nr:polysaccharide biosynthesis/export family protein [Flavobacterium sp.]